MSDTPKTDSRHYGYSIHGTELVSADFARSLERESEQLKSDAIILGLALCDERDRWRAVADELAKRVSLIRMPDKEKEDIDALAAYEKLKGNKP